MFTVVQHRFVNDRPEVTVVAHYDDFDLALAEAKRLLAERHDPDEAYGVVVEADRAGTAALTA